MTTLLVTSDIKADTQTIKDAMLTIEEHAAQTSGIKQDTAQIASLAQEIGPLRAQLNKRNEADGKSQVLQRFLNDSSGYAESFVDATEWEDSDTTPESFGFPLDQTAWLELSEPGNVEKVHAEDEKLEFTVDASAPKMPAVGNSNPGLQAPEVAEPSGTATDTTGENLRHAFKIDETVSQGKKTSSPSTEHHARPTKDHSSEAKTDVSKAEEVDVAESAFNTTVKTPKRLRSRRSCPRIGDDVLDLAATDEAKGQSISIGNDALDQETPTNTGSAIHPPIQEPDSTPHLQAAIQGSVSPTVTAEQAEVEAAKSRRLKMSLVEQLELDQRLRIAISGVDDANFGEDANDSAGLRAKCSRTSVKDKDYIKKLLDQGADPNIRTFGFDLLAVEIWNAHRIDVVALILTYGIVKSPHLLCPAILTNNEEAIIMLLRNGVDADGDLSWCVSAGKNSISTPPLYLAVDHCKLKAMRILLEHGVQVNKVTGPNGSALLAAISGLEYSNLAAKYLGRWKYCSTGWGCIETVKLLLHHGADVNARGTKFGGPLENAIRSAPEEKEVEVVKLLLKNGAKISTGHTKKPLYVAASNGRGKLIEVLLDHGAPIDEKGGPRGSALHGAVYYGSPETVEVLLSRGADIKAVVRDFGPLKISPTISRGDPDNRQILALFRKKGYKGRISE